MHNHPEQKQDEEFLANAPRERGHHKRFRHLKTIRVGEQAYCVFGTTKNMSHMVPLFVGKSEFAEYNRIWEKSVTEDQRYGTRKVSS